MIAPYRPQYFPPSNFTTGHISSDFYIQYSNYVYYSILFYPIYINGGLQHGNRDKGFYLGVMHLSSHERYTFLRTKISHNSCFNSLAKGEELKGEDFL